MASYAKLFPAKAQIDLLYIAKYRSIVIDAPAVAVADHKLSVVPSRIANDKASF